MKKIIGITGMIGNFLLFSAISCFSQNTFDPLSVPVEESGISVEEYNDLKKNKTVVTLSTEENESFTLELIKVNSNINDGIRVVEKNNPNKPIWSLIPYNIIREEDYNENK
jgi:hypothetical protein